MFTLNQEETGQTQKDTEFRFVMGIYSKAFKTGFKEARKKEWQCCELQTRLKYKTNNQIKAREFGNKQEADKFKQHLFKTGYSRQNTHSTKEVVNFVGLAGISLKPVNVVYYSKNKLKLNPENHKTSNEFKLLYKYLIKPHTHKPTKKEIKKFKEVLPARAKEYSPTPI